MRIVDLYNTLERAMNDGMGEGEVVWENDRLEGKLHLMAGVFLHDGKLVVFRAEEHE